MATSRDMTPSLITPEQPTIPMGCNDLKSLADHRPHGTALEIHASAKSVSRLGRVAEVQWARAPYIWPDALMSRFLLTNVLHTILFSAIAVTELTSRVTVLRKRRDLRVYADPWSLEVWFLGSTNLFHR